MFCFATAFATCLWRPSISVRLVSVVVTSSSLSSSHRVVGPKCKHSQPVSVECVYVNFVTVYEIGETLVKTSEQRALAFRFDLVTLGGLVDRSARDERNSLPLRRGPWSGESQLEPSALADYKFRTWKKKKKKKLLLSGECVWSFQLRNRVTFVTHSSAPSFPLTHAGLTSGSSSLSLPFKGLYMQNPGVFCLIWHLLIATDLFVVNAGGTAVLPNWISL